VVAEALPRVHWKTRRRSLLCSAMGPACL
jgi:hypothetical protein